VVAKKAANGDVTHAFLTTLIDAGGNMRVQYLGYGFDPSSRVSSTRRSLIWIDGAVRSGRLGPKNEPAAREGACG
jgi:hypothetical protein